MHGWQPNAELRVCVVGYKWKGTVHLWPLAVEFASTNKTGIRLRNGLIALAAVAVAVLVFSVSRAQSPSLRQLAAEAVPLEQALTNGKPTFVEFYADWCASCQTMAPVVADLKTRYGDKVNFVMLNVDNPRWLPELLKYEVDGIPHYAFLSPKGKTLTSIIGLQPETVMAQNLQVLATGSRTLPKTNVTAGRTSEFKPPQPKPTQPRAHSE